ncbi:MAG: outer membrane homotrimeric porin [Desulfovibrio sp.]|nr:outer membrane homotrimeric porin [Desulfovibrio sp.]
MSKKRKTWKAFKKACMVTLLAAGMVMGVQTGAKAIDFKAQGEWLVGFGLSDGRFVDKVGGHKTDSEDNFNAGQRIRLQLDAVASEALSGTVYFEIGDQKWGSDVDAQGGAALGADGNGVVKVKNAYIDWMVPQTDLKLRMGLQGIALPNAAGGSAILDADVAAVTANYKFNDNVGLTVLWMRPVNDNFGGWTRGGGTARDTNYLDNIDLFTLSVPLTFDGIEVTPWATYGIMGKNSLDGYDDGGVVRYNGNRLSGRNAWSTSDGILHHTLINYAPGFNTGTGDLSNGFGKSHAYSSLFWFGLPISLTLWDPLNIELEFDYGYSGGFGSYDLWKRGDSLVRADSRREGWLIKALVEYKFDWGVPGIFGWYASGDDGDMKNGSKRLPSISGAGTFTSFMGAGGTDWAPYGRGNLIEYNMTYAGTWGVGLQVRDMSFLEDLTHTFRVALWGGTNSPSMVKYFNDREAAMQGAWGSDGPYMTTHDNLLEFNLDNTYQIYENLAVNLDLGYIVNMYDSDTWNRRWMDDDHVSKKDAWKAQVTFAYTF